MTGSTFFKKLLVACAWLLICFVALGFTGRFLAIADAAAILRPQLGALLVILSALLWWRLLRMTAITSLGVGLVAVLSVMSSLTGTERPCTDTCLTLYQKNLLSKAWPRYPLAEDIIASGADVVTLQEVSTHNRTYMAALFDHYPTAVTCPFRVTQDVAVLTSLPVVKGSAFCLSGAGMAGLRLRAPDGQTFWVISLHMHWPFPFEQYAQSRKIAAFIADLDAPVLIAGDFNMVPWGAAVGRVARAAGNRRLRGIQNTYLAGSAVLPLPIDMVLVPDTASGRVERRPLMGSDHYGLFAKINLGPAR